MPAYNFQTRFVPMILNGSKPHTIRRRRKRPTRVGDPLWLYTGMRTKQCKMFAAATCVKVEPILLYLLKKEVWVWSPEQPGDLYYQEGEEIGSYRLLRAEEVNSLSRQDGFGDVYEFFDFFKRYKRHVLDDFEIIYWDPDELMSMPDDSKYGTIKVY